MTFKQVSFLIAEIDRVLALSNSQNLPAQVVLSEQAQVLVKLRNYLQTISFSSIPSTLIAQIETMITTQVELKKQQLQHLSLHQQSLSEEIYQLENQKQGLIANFSEPEPDPFQQDRSASTVSPPETLTSPIIIQEQRFQEWTEVQPKHTVPQVIDSLVSTSQMETPTPIETISALTDLITQHLDDLDPTAPSWYLGLDFGTSGISGVLFNGDNFEQYPLYWLTDDGETFRLPVQAKANNSSFQVDFDVSNYFDQNSILLSNFKPLLNLAIPYYSSQFNQWQPNIKLLNIPFKFLLDIIVELLIKIQSSSETMAIDLSPETFQEAVDNLQGVIINCPAAWGDTYRFNLREAVLQAELLPDSAQIFFVEEAIASIISRCPVPPSKISDNPSLLLINFGASTTELALVSFPENLTELTYSDFTTQSLAYGGEAFEQDIFLELVYPHFSYLQPSLLELDLDLPEVAEINPDKRHFLTLALQTKPLGKSILDIAKQVDLILQQQPEFSCKIGGTPWQIKRQNLELKIILPVLKQLEQQLDILFSLAGKNPDCVSQIICSGGYYSSLSNLCSSLLNKKYPNAVLIQDSLEESELAVAIGLSRLPLFPKIIDYARHQYSDYFLLLEFLEALPTQDFSFEEILRRLSWRGINTRTCTEKILGFLHGNLPQGLFPAKSNLFTDAFFQDSPVLVTEKQGKYSANLSSCQALRQYLTEILSNTRQTLTEPLIVNLAI